MLTIMLPMEDRPMTGKEIITELLAACEESIDDYEALAYEPRGMPACRRARIEAIRRAIALAKREIYR